MAWRRLNGTCSAMPSTGVRGWSVCWKGEIAEALGISRRTVERDAQLAKAWLYRELEGE